MSRHVHLSASELVRACAVSRDERPWAEFIRRFEVVITAAVLRTARLWGEPSRSLLDDLIQDTYLKLCEDNSRLLRSFQPRRDDSIYGFLKVVAANVVHDHFRSAMAAKRGVSRTGAFTEPAPANPGTPELDSFDVVSHRIQLGQVEKILIKVTAGKDQGKKRAIFWLRHRLGLTASEIACIPSIGLTTEGVESVLMRLGIMIRNQLISPKLRREVKVLTPQKRSRRMGK